MAARSGLAAFEYVIRQKFDVRTHGFGCDHRLRRVGSGKYEWGRNTESGEKAKAHNDLDN